MIKIQESIEISSGIEVTSSTSFKFIAGSIEEYFSDDNRTKDTFILLRADAGLPVDPFVWISVEDAKKLKEFLSKHLQEYRAPEDDRDSDE